MLVKSTSYLTLILSETQKPDNQTRLFTLRRKMRLFAQVNGGGWSSRPEAALGAVEGFFLCVIFEPRDVLLHLLLSCCLGRCQFELIVGVSWWSSAGYIIQKWRDWLCYLIWGTAWAAAPITHTLCVCSLSHRSAEPERTSPPSTPLCRLCRATPSTGWGGHGRTPTGWNSARVLFIIIYPAFAHR